ncbi:MAG: hypothetical protein Q8K37_06180, partial [Alphaproteobacteria bacterium]|nr:hypothetical protein [Alphaproteobacteria bacterium]
MTEKEKLVQELVISDIKECVLAILEMLPNIFQNQFAEEQEKFNKIYQAHFQKTEWLMQQDLFKEQQKTLTDFYSNFSEEELKEFNALNNTLVSKKAENILSECQKCNSEYSFDNMLQRLLKIKHGLSKDDEIKTIPVVNNNSQKQKFINQLVESKLLESAESYNFYTEQLMPTFEHFSKIEQVKFKEVFKEKCDQILKNILDIQKEISKTLLTRHFNEQELVELLKIQNNPVIKKMTEEKNKMPLKEEISIKKAIEIGLKMLN